MKKLALALFLMPSLALAHPGHDDVGAGGDPTTHAFITNPVLVLLLCVGIMMMVTRVVRMVRK